VSYLKFQDQFQDHWICIYYNLQGPFLCFHPSSDLSLTKQEKQPGFLEHLELTEVFQSAGLLDWNSHPDRSLPEQSNIPAH